MTDFEAREGRAPGTADKEKVKDLFINYKKAEVRVTEIAAQRDNLSKLLEEKRAQSSALAPTPVTALTPVEYKALPVASEALGLARARVQQLQGREGELRQALAQEEEAKKNSRATVKQWLTEFEAREGRQPTNTDKESVKHLFIDFKRAEAQAKLTSDSLGETVRELGAAREALQELERTQSVPVPVSSSALQRPPVSGTEGLKEEVTPSSSSVVMTQLRQEVEELRCVPSHVRIY
jgi:predicted transcriptional regulator